MVASRRFLRLVFKLRGLLMLPPVVFVTLSTQWETENEFLVFGLGGCVLGLGLLLRLLSQMHLRYRLRTKTILTTTGPYALSRNPIYVGNTLILVGTCLLCEMLWFAPVMLGWCALVYALVVRHEEAHLAGKYGQPYLDYVASVPRWAPWRLAKCIAIPERAARPFLGPSILAEAHSLLFLVLPVVKELLT